MNSQQIAHGAVRALALFGGAGLVLGAILALFSNLKAHKGSPARVSTCMPGWWWRVPVAAGIIAALSIPFGITLLIFSVGIGMSAGTHPGGGGTMFGVVAMFTIISSVPSYLLLRLWQPVLASDESRTNPEGSVERSPPRPIDEQVRRE